MYGAGVDVFAVWGYVIANTVNSRVELNPMLLASVLGSTPDKVEAAIAKLCGPDEKSRSTAHDGRRLVREGQFQYFVVNHETYRAIRNEEDRRAYNREKQRESRARRRLVNQDVIDSQSLSALSAHTEAEADTEVNTRHRFAPPTVEEVKTYCQERKNGIDPQAFVDHYQASGWVRGKTKIKDWRACVRTWEKNRKDKEKPKLHPDHQYAK